MYGRASNQSEYSKKRRKKGKQIQINGFKIGEDVYAFPTEDPNITLSLWGLSGEEDNLLEAVMEVTRMPMETVKHLQKRGLFS